MLVINCFNSRIFSLIDRVSIASRINGLIGFSDFRGNRLFLRCFLGRGQRHILINRGLHLISGFRN